MAQKDAAGHSIIDDVPKCRDAVDALLQQPLVAVDAEGVAMGRPGPVTLIQVAMGNGHVYLFDVYRHGHPTPEMFSEGGLKEFLESPSVVKVMHASANDNSVLKKQYGVTLNNIYDVQVAQQILEESEGRQLPRTKKLRDICSLYLTDTSPLESKDDVQAKWRLDDAEFWARRPFTPEMTDYACADVRLLIPEVYEKQLDLVRKKHLEASVAERTKEELDSRFDKEVQKAAQKRWDDKVDAVIRQIEERCPQGVELSQLQEDELEALSWARFPERQSEIIQSLEVQFNKRELAEIRDGLRKEGRDFMITGFQYFLLGRLKRHRDEFIRKESRKLLEQVEKLEIERMSSKYRESTPLKHISDQDKRVISSVRLKSDGCPILFHLACLVKEEELDKDMQSFRSNLDAFKKSFRPNAISFYRFLMVGEGLPETLQVKAKEFLDMLEAEEMGQPPPKSSAPKSRKPRKPRR